MLPKPKTEAPNDVYFIFNESGGWYWKGKYRISDVYSDYADCLAAYIDWESKTAEDFIPSAATHGGV